MLPCDLVQYRVCFSSRPRSCRCAGATWPLGVSCGLPGVTGVYGVPCVLVGLCISSWGLWVIRLCRRCGGPPHKHPNRSADTPRGVIGGLSKVAGCPGDLCVKSGMEGGVGWWLRDPGLWGRDPPWQGAGRPAKNSREGERFVALSPWLVFRFTKRIFKIQGSQPCMPGHRWREEQALCLRLYGCGSGGSGPGEVCSSQVTEPAQRGW